MEENKFQTNAEEIKEMEHLSKKICKTALHDCIGYVACMCVIGICGEVFLLNNSPKAKSVAATMAVGAGFASVGMGKIFNKKKQKLMDQKNQVLKRLAQKALG